VDVEGFTEIVGQTPEMLYRVSQRSSQRGIFKRFHDFMGALGNLAAKRNRDIYASFWDGERISRNDVATVAEMCIHIFHCFLSFWGGDPCDGG
jgi:hypothetical protein